MRRRNRDGGDTPRQRGVLAGFTAFHAVLVTTGFGSVANSMAAGAMSQIAATLTASNMLIALVLFALQLPSLLCGILLGEHLNHWDKRTSRRNLNLGNFLVVGFLSTALVADWNSLGTVYAASLALGFLGALTDPLTTAEVGLSAGPGPEGNDDAQRSYRAVYLVFGRIIGPTLGAVLFARATGLPVYVSLLVFAVNQLAFTACRTRRTAEPDQPARGSTTSAPAGRFGGVRRLLADLRQNLASGKELMRLQQGSNAMTGVLCVTNLANQAASAVMVPFSVQRLGMGNTGIIVILAFSGVGSVLGTAAGRFLRRVGTYPLLIITSMVCMSTNLAMVVVSSPWLAGTAMAVNGAIGGMVQVRGQIIRHHDLDPGRYAQMEARFLAFYRGGATAGPPLGGAVGWSSVTAPFVFAAAVMGTMGVVLAGMAVRNPGRFPQLARGST
jgi:MFS family permease